MVIKIIALVVTALSGVVFPATGKAPGPYGGFAGIHPGVDITAPANTPVFSGQYGVVVFAGQSGDQYASGYGNLVIVQGTRYQTWYAHLSRFNVSVGNYVSSDTIIGFVGSSGHSTGPHLHWEIRSLDGCNLINPYTGDVVGAPKNYSWMCGVTQTAVAPPVTPAPTPAPKPKVKVFRYTQFFKLQGVYIR